MAKLTPPQVYALARTAGLDPAQSVVATAVAMGESGLNPDAVGDVNIQTGDWGPSIGLWQIRSLKSQSGTGKSRDATRLKDPMFNARAMVEISGDGKNWRPWSVFTNGTYKKYLSQVSTQVVQTETTSMTDIVNAVEGAAGAGAGAVAGAVGDAAAALNPFSGWQNDVLGIGLKLAVTGAALVLAVAGVRAAVNDKT